MCPNNGQQSRVHTTDYSAGSISGGLCQLHLCAIGIVHTRKCLRGSTLICSQVKQFGQLHGLLFFLLRVGREVGRVNMASFCTCYDCYNLIVLHLISQHSTMPYKTGGLMTKRTELPRHCVRDTILRRAKKGECLQPWESTERDNARRTTYSCQAEHQIPHSHQLHSA